MTVWKSSESTDSRPCLLTPGVSGKRAVQSLWSRTWRDESRRPGPPSWGRPWGQGLGEGGRKLLVERTVLLDRTLLSLSTRDLLLTPSSRLGRRRTALAPRGPLSETRDLPLNL